MLLLLMNNKSCKRNNFFKNFGKTEGHLTGWKYIAKLYFQFSFVKITICVPDNRWVIDFLNKNYFPSNYEKKKSKIINEL